MAKNQASKSARKTLTENMYDSREAPSPSKPQDTGNANQLGSSFTSSHETERQDHQSLQEKEQSLKKLENDLSKREVELIEREIKVYSLQQEVDNMRPLSGLYRVVKAMATERKLESLFEVIRRETKGVLKCDRCSVYVVEANKGELWTRSSDEEDSRLVRIALDRTSIVSASAKSGKVCNIANAYDDARFDPEDDRSSGYLTRNVLCVPMHDRNGDVIGVFEARNKLTGPFTGEDEEWLQSLAAVAAGLIEQAQAYAEIESFMDKTLETLAQTIDKRDPLTAGHSLRVTKYSMLIGEALNVTHSDMDILRYSAMMHDYGKIGVPEAILWKNGRLTPEEYSCVQQHAKLTYDLLSNLPFTKRLASVPFVASCHHEKLDGSGYYRGLKGAEIPFLTRIITAADVFDALTSVRHYRNRMAIAKVSEIMEGGRDNHFDPEVIDAFYRLPCDSVLKIMESERGQAIPPELDLFKHISWYRLVELVSGAKPESHEQGLRELFNEVYNAGLPSDYQALD